MQWADALALFVPNWDICLIWGQLRDAQDNTALLLLVSFDIFVQVFFSCAAFPADVEDWNSFISSDKIVPDGSGTQNSNSSITSTRLCTHAYLKFDLSKKNKPSLLHLWQAASAWVDDETEHMPALFQSSLLHSVTTQSESSVTSCRKYITGKTSFFFFLNNTLTAVHYAFESTTIRRSLWEIWARGSITRSSQLVSVWQSLTCTTAGSPNHTESTATPRSRQRVD